MINPIEQLMLESIRKRVGAMTSKEALEMALFTEQTCSDVGEHDPAYDHFLRQKEGFLKYAVLLEKEEAAAKEAA
jgi:hypothetical protein